VRQILFTKMAAGGQLEFDFGILMQLKTQ